MRLNKEQKIKVLELCKTHVVKGDCTCYAIKDACIALGYPTVYIQDMNVRQSIFKLREAAIGIEDCDTTKGWWFSSYDEITLKNRLQLVDNAIKIIQNESD